MGKVTEKGRDLPPIGTIAFPFGQRPLVPEQARPFPSKARLPVAFPVAFPPRGDERGASGGLLSDGLLVLQQFVLKIGPGIGVLVAGLLVEQLSIEEVCHP